MNKEIVTTPFQPSLYSNAAGLEKDAYAAVAACFLGPKAENEEFFIRLLEQGIRKHMEVRKNYYADEEPYIDQAVREKQPYKEMQEQLESSFETLCQKLQDSVPFFSQRYQGHMNWDTVMAGSLGYMAAILYNQNNVATEASPVTSQLEQEAGRQLCELLGFPVTSGPSSGWGHITADGTIANIEAMWAARNLKAYPLALHEMLSDPVHQEIFKQPSREITVSVCGEEKAFLSCNSWELMNLPIDESLELANTIETAYGVSNEQLDELLKPYLLATRGIAEYSAAYREFSNVRVFVPVTHHYSWPKAATLLGLGQNSIVGIPVDENCQMDTALLESELSQCLANKTPVLMVVGVVGSTAEGAIDDIEAIIRLKETFAQKGLQFNLHCDAAWGGYLKTMLVEPPSLKVMMDVKSHYVPSLPLSDHAVAQYNAISKADTITVDPHKAGFIPYAAGALCYRNGQLRNLITFNAAYIHSDQDTNMGIYGVEGSKPGAAAAAVWLAHAAIPLDKYGYGQILGECSYSSKLNYCYWITMAPKEPRTFSGMGDKKYSYCVQPLIDLPNQLAGLSSREEILDYIKDNILYQDAEVIADSETSMKLLGNVGADVLMNAFLVNFTVDGIPNSSIEKLNSLNNRLFKRFSITKGCKPEDRPEYVLMMNTLSSSQYGKAFSHILKAWNLHVPASREQSYSLNVLVNTVLQPWPNTPKFMENTLAYLDRIIWEELEEMEKGNSL